MAGALTGSQQEQLADATRTGNGLVGEMKSRLPCAQGSPQQLAVAQRYMKCRLAQDHAGVLALCHPNVILTSQRDGRHVGIPAFKAYLEKTAIEGEWSVPALDPATGMMKFNGRIKWAGVIPISVVGYVAVDQQGKITEILVCKA